MENSAKSYSEAKRMLEEKNSATFKKYGLFFAFSDKQFEENKTPLEEGDTYVSYGGGGYCPKNKFKDLSSEFDKNIAWMEEQTKLFPKEAIGYELGNHECYYTGDIEIVINIFHNVFSPKLILETYLELCKTVEVY